MNDSKVAETYSAIIFNPNIPNVCLYRARSEYV
ncbi:hypothetical protein PMI36_04325 [Pseudomonas sp. GM79]|nr:hypothetical protein PMI36_04325 [Pseudomonas sp. GM79]MCP1446081.1 hypothetical protein [Pseudomonas sp. GGS8]